VANVHAVKASIELKGSALPAPTTPSGMEPTAHAQIVILPNGASEGLTPPSPMDHAVVKVDTPQSMEFALHPLESYD
jgi:hypothetical protein